jgi:hypothetical protein
LNWHFCVLSRNFANNVPRASEAVKKLNVHFFARLFSISYRRKNRYFSINSQLLLPVPGHGLEGRGTSGETEVSAHHGPAGGGQTLDVNALLATRDAETMLGALLISA